MTLSVLTMNLWHDSGPWPRRADRLRAWIDKLQPDLIGFQEVLHVAERTQAAELLDGLGYRVDYVEASHERRSFGNAVASRWPISEREPLVLPKGRDDRETRAALRVVTDSPFGPIALTCTHLNWRWEHGEIRERQVAALGPVAARRPADGRLPPILVGDFNAEPDSAEVRFLTGRQSLDGGSVAFLDAWAVAGDGGAGHSWSSRNPYARYAVEPDRRIDYVFVGLPERTFRGVGKILKCAVVCDDGVDGVWPSDHFGVFAELSTDEIQGWGPPPT